MTVGLLKKNTEEKTHFQPKLVLRVTLQHFFIWNSNSFKSVEWNIPSVMMCLNSKLYKPLYRQCMSRLRLVLQWGASNSLSLWSVDLSENREIVALFVNTMEETSELCWMDNYDRPPEKNFGFVDKVRPFAAY